MSASAEESVIRSTGRPHRGREWIGAREAEQILGISRAACIKLAQCGKLPGKLLDRPGARRHYQFKLADVLRLKNEGTALKSPARPPRIRAAWLRLFGPIPAGFTVISRDGSHSNTTPGNLALIPLRTAVRMRRRRSRHKQTRWTLEMRALLLRDFTTRSTEEIAQECGCSVLAVRNQARRMGLRKSGEYIRQAARRSRALPIGTERLMTHDKNAGIVLVKVSNEGTQSQQWRPKNHVIWEQANGRKVPAGFRIIFKDGDHQNFDPENLAAIAREELGARALARFLNAPAPLRKVVRLNKSLRREIRRQMDEAPEPQAPARQRPSLKGRALIRWTPAMVAVLERDYPTRPVAEIAAAIGVTAIAAKAKASKLGIRRAMETIIAEASAKYGESAHG